MSLEDLADEILILPAIGAALFEQSPDSIVLVNNKGIIRLVNPRTEFLFGYHRKEMIGKEVEILMPEPYRPRHKIHFAKFWEDPSMRSMGIGMKLEAMHKSGSPFPVEIKLSPVSTQEYGQLAIAIIRRLTAIAGEVHG